MTDHAAKLKKSGEAYQRARDKAERIMAQPREDLTEEVRAAYAAGMTKANILRAMGHVWSRTWLDQTLKTPDGEETPPHQAA